MSSEKDPSNLMKQIDENLRRVYREVEKDDVPDRFKQLLDKLRQQDSSDEK